MSDPASRAGRLNRAIGDLLAQAPEVEAAAVVSFDGLPMASALPATMDEDRVAAMSAALLSLGERAAEGLGRGGLNQVYIEGENGTVFLVSADDEAVLVAVAAKAAKVGMMLYEVRRAAASVADVLRAEPVEPDEPEATVTEVPSYTEPVAYAEPLATYAEPVPTYVDSAPTYTDPTPTYAESAPSYADPVGAQVPPASYPAPTETAWPTYQSNGTTGSTEPTTWS